MPDPTPLQEVIGSHGGQLPDGTLAVSYSRLSRYQQCGEAYRLQYKERVSQEPSGAAIAGSLIHDLIEEMVVDGWFHKPDIVEEYGAAQFRARFPVAVVEAGGVPITDDEGTVLDYTGIRWGGRKRALRDDQDKIIRGPDGKSIMVGENFPWFQKVAPTWLKRAASILRDDVQAGVIIESANIEVGVAAWLDGPGSTLITGIIDAMLLQGPTGPVIRDWKTGTFMPGPMQLANYGWLLAHLEDETHRIEATRGEMIYLRGSTKATWVRGYELEPLMPLVPRMFRDMLRGLDAEVFHLVPSSFCGSCWVRQHCEYGKTLDQ